MAVNHGALTRRQARWADDDTVHVPQSLLDHALLYTHI